MKRLPLALAALLVFTFALWACPGPSGPSGGGNEVSCTNGKDDNGDGKVDCDDPQCSEHPSCQPVTTVDAGPTCTSQSQCIVTSYIYDDPLPACTGGKCVKNAKGIQIRFEVNVAALSGAGWPNGSMNTRFILKRAVDGSEVSCATVRALAPGKTPDKASQLEGSKLLNLLAYDVTGASEPTASSYVIQPFLHTGIGADFLIWTEIWSGKVDSDTKLPTGMRLGFGCTETGTATTELKATDDVADGGTGRTIRVSITDLG